MCCINSAGSPAQSGAADIFSESDQGASEPCWNVLRLPLYLSDLYINPESSFVQELELKLKLVQRAQHRAGASLNSHLQADRAIQIVKNKFDFLLQVWSQHQCAAACTAVPCGSWSACGISGCNRGRSSPQPPPRYAGMGPPAQVDMQAGHCTRPSLPQAAEHVFHVSQTDLANKVSNGGLPRTPPPRSAACAASPSRPRRAALGRGNAKPTGIFSAGTAGVALRRGHRERTKN